MTINQIHKAIRAAFDVEYIGGVGWCGPRWREAQAIYNAITRGRNG